MKSFYQQTFESFIHGIRDFGSAEIVIRARAAILALETHILNGGKAGAMDLVFQKRLQDFINVFESGVVTTEFKSDALLCKELAQALVKKKELGQDVLDAIERKLRDM